MAMTGSEIAKGGFKNEQDVADKFNNWKNDKDAQEWLKIMMYDLDDVEYVRAEKIGQKGYKSDINVVIRIRVKKKQLETIENIQVKLVSSEKKGFNQVEKRKVEQYVEKWHITPEIEELLKLYDGELSPRAGSREPNRMFVNEFTAEEQKILLEFFQKNIIMIISDVIMGRGRFAAEWTLIIQSYDAKYNWKLMAVNEAISIYAGDCKAIFTKQGNVKLGNITLQRKGGDNGADSANMLQFKANPLILFND
jgi:hypothetical protein